jgi:hypothetical protein
MTDYIIHMQFAINKKTQTDILLKTMIDYNLVASHIVRGRVKRMKKNYPGARPHNRLGPAGPFKIAPIARLGHVGHGADQNTSIIKTARTSLSKTQNLQERKSTLLFSCL